MKIVLMRVKKHNTPWDGDIFRGSPEKPEKTRTVSWTNWWALDPRKEPTASRDPHSLPVFVKATFISDLLLLPASVPAVCIPCAAACILGAAVCILYVAVCILCVAACSCVQLCTFCVQLYVSRVQLYASHVQLCASLSSRRSLLPPVSCGPCWASATLWEVITLSSCLLLSSPKTLSLENWGHSPSPAVPGNRPLVHQLLVTDSICNTHLYSLHF